MSSYTLVPSFLWLHNTRILFICSWADKHLGVPPPTSCPLWRVPLWHLCTHFCVHVDFHFSRAHRHLGVALLGQMEILCLAFWETTKQFWPSGRIILHSKQQAVSSGSPNSPHPHFHLLLSVFSTRATQETVNGISLWFWFTFHYIDYLFVYVLAITYLLYRNVYLVLYSFFKWVVIKL